MADQGSAIIPQDEAAEQSAFRGASAALRGARANLLLALVSLGNQQQPIEGAAARHDHAWLARTYPDWVDHRRVLRTEVQELRRLLDHIDLVLSAAGMSS